ncbi:MAG: glycosyltransferase family 4 protein [Saprospiraceae bacterium]|nr:glycosyltransferase family 4 protein [Saprospiraceae bacterium]MDW8483792.1 glycosyltransferase family 4 protein [Saprospiraceae bacterium]
MKIALLSPNFYPLIGGLERMVAYMAQLFVEQGHKVVVLCRTPTEEPDMFPFRVVRKPSFWQAWATCRSAEVILSFNVSLKEMPAILLSGRTFAVSHQTPYSQDNLGRVKTWVARYLAKQNIYCSAYLAAHTAAPGTVIPNAYDEQTFYCGQPWIFRTRDLVFVGRLVSDKGADVLLRALARLHAAGLPLKLTLVGQGPEEETLRQLAAELCLREWVAFEGLKQGTELAALLNEHRVLVVPSVWPEPFGIVALEGLACGCIVVASNTGGLPEALGGLGVLFPPGDEIALADAIAHVWKRPLNFLPPAEKVAAHLRAHTRQTIAERYLDVLTKIVRKK